MPSGICDGVGNVLGFSDSVMGSWAFGYDPLNQDTIPNHSFSWIRSESDCSRMPSDQIRDCSNHVHRSSSDPTLPGRRSKRIAVGQSGANQSASCQVFAAMPGKPKRLPMCAFVVTQHPCARFCNRVALDILRVGAPQMESFFVHAN